MIYKEKAMKKREIPKKKGKNIRSIEIFKDWLNLGLVIIQSHNTTNIEWERDVKIYSLIQRTNSDNSENKIRKISNLEKTTLSATKHQREWLFKKIL